MISIKKNEAPKLQKCTMKCDIQLDKKLNDYELTTFLNTHTSSIILGRPGSGKSSLLHSFFQSNKLLKGVYDNIFLFIPVSSLASMGDKNIYSTLSEDKVYHELTDENLSYVLEYINNEPESNNCIIIDDMGSHLKDTVILKKLKKCLFNMRHIHTSIFFLCQTWKSMPKELRSIVSNLFIFKVSKFEFESICEEIINIKRDCINDLMYLVYSEKFSFLFYNINSNRLFKNFDELILGN